MLYQLSTLLIIIQQTTLTLQGVADGKNLRRVNSFLSSSSRANNARLDWTQKFEGPGVSETNTTR